MLVSLSTLLVTRIAIADSDLKTEQLEDRRDHSAVSMNVGLFTPTGSLGAEYTQVLHPNVELGVGAGLGYLAAAALDGDYHVRPEVSVMPRVRVRYGALRLAVGAGLSAGSYQDEPSPFDDGGWHDQASLVMWANGEGVAQLISRTGWFGAARLGGSYLVAHSTMRTSGDATHMPTDAQGAAYPYLGLSFGRTL